MPQAAIDYDALAAQHGGMPDYDALASEHGGTAADFSTTNATDAEGKPVVVERGPSWSDRLGVPASMPSGFPGVPAKSVMDFAEGAVSGLASTAFHGGDLIRRTLGMERVINTPEAQRAMQAPDTFAGKAGQVVEQGAEFALPLSRISKAAAGLSWLPRVAAEGAAGASVAGVQSGGDEGAMALGMLAPAVGSAAAKGVGAAYRTASRAAAGAAEGGFGGAVAGAMRKVVPAAPKAMMVQGLKPAANRLGFEQSLDRSMPLIKEAAEAAGQPIHSLDDLLSASRVAKQNVRAQIESLMESHRGPSFTADTSKVADAIEQSIPSRVLRQEPGKVAQIKKLAQTYRTRLDIDEIDDSIRQINAELDAYYGKYPAARAQATTNPDTAQALAEVGALREIRDQVLDAPGGGAAAKELYRRYGSLLELERAAHRRANVAKRQQPESLSEQMSKILAARDIARAGMRMLRGDFLGAGKVAVDLAGARAGMEAATFIKQQQTTDNLIKRAFQTFRGASTPIEMPPPFSPAGLLPGRQSGPQVGPSGKGPIPMGPERPDPSSVSGVRGAYGARVAVPAKDIGFRLEEIARVTPGGPRGLPSRPGVKGGIAARSEDVNHALRWMLADMDAIPFSPRTFIEAGKGRGGDLQVTGGAAGAPIYRAIIGLTEQQSKAGVSGPSRARVAQAIREIIEGKGQPSKLKAQILDVAREIADGGDARKLMTLPPSAGQTAKDAARDMEDAVLSRWTVDGDAPVGREPGEEGRATIGALMGLGAGAGAAAAVARGRGTRKPPR